MTFAPATGVSVDALSIHERHIVPMKLVDIEAAMAAKLFGVRNVSSLIMSNWICPGLLVFPTICASMYADGIAVQVLSDVCKAVVAWARVITGVPGGQRVRHICTKCVVYLVWNRDGPRVPFDLYDSSQQLTATVARVTRVRSSKHLVSTHFPIAITSDWLIMSSSDSASARLVSGEPIVSSGGALTAFVPQRVETRSAIAISMQLAKVIFFMRGSFRTNFLTLETDRRSEQTPG